MATWTISDKIKLKMIDGSNLDLATAGDTIKFLIADATHAPVAADEFLADATLTEVSGTNYTAGGETLGSQTATETGGTTTFDGADITISESAGGFADGRYGVLYKDTGNTATSPIIAFTDFGAAKGNTGGDLTFSWNASGIFTIA